MLHYCDNGVSVTEQVIEFQKTRNNDDYVQIQNYYNEYKDQWYFQLEDYMDKETFDSEFDFKLYRAVSAFNGKEGTNLAIKHGWTFLGAFNRWFYRILSNWKSNVKSSSFRIKKRQSVQCPVCHRHVGKIDVEHLKHFRSVGDLPKYFVFQGEIYETCSKPKIYAITWGKKTTEKIKCLRKGDVKTFGSERKKIPWPWYIDGCRVVVCPYTKKHVNIIDEEYISTLPSKFSRYAKSTSWEQFQEEHPKALIQSELYTIDTTEAKNEDNPLSAKIASNNTPSLALTYEDVCKGKKHILYDDSFKAIDDCVVDEADRSILKLLAIGYSLDDITDELNVDIKTLRKRIKLVRENKELFERLVK